MAARVRCRGLDRDRLAGDHGRGGAQWLCSRAMCGARGRATRRRFLVSDRRRPDSCDSLVEFQKAGASELPLFSFPPLCASVVVRFGSDGLR